MRTFFSTIFFVVIFILISCKRPDDKTQLLVKNSNEANTIKCTENNCIGTYIGPEFINNDDIANQFSNKMARYVGDKLKELYKKGNYKKVNFSKIYMSTEGMGSGKVTYTLKIPFSNVKNRCEAYTSFDHVGGWNHKPALERRKKELQSVLMKNHELDISELKTTPEGLQEYWIQWKNKTVQVACK